MSKLKLLLERAVHEDIENAKQFLIDHDIEFDEDIDIDYYIDSGKFGDVYKLKDRNKVLKIYNSSEVQNKKHQKILEEKNLEYICNIYFDREMSDGIYVSIMDYLELPNSEIYEAPMNIQSFTSHIEDQFYINKDKRGVSIKKNLRKTVKYYLKISDSLERDDIKPNITKLVKTYSNNIELLDIFLDIFTGIILPYERDAYNFDKVIEFVIDHPKYYKDILKGVKEYKKMGFEHGDLHNQNVLFDPKSKNYKLIDPM